MRERDVFDILADRPVIERAFRWEASETVKRKAPREQPAPIYSYLRPTAQPGPRGCKRQPNRAKIAAARKANVRRQQR